METTEINRQWMMMKKTGLRNEAKNEAWRATSMLPGALWNMGIQTNTKWLTYCAIFESVLIYSAEFFI